MPHEDDELRRAGLRPVYTASPVDLGPPWLWPSLTAVVAVLALVQLVVADAWQQRVLPFLVLLSPLSLAAARRWPPRTYVEPDGVRVRRGVPRGRLVAWEDVTAVRVQGRWDDFSTVSTREGRTLTLYGMEPGDAERLREVVTARGRSGDG
ncbi:PH domain-containing protein [Kineococcus sp. SYSU DK004]|uniref:PH domain-containing protein n=1 Tax=Kineococcus sp. SYSU DK004 TaxID=3383125 RepID=UPI003D7D3464